MDHAAAVLYPDRFDRELAPGWLRCVVNALGYPAPRQSGSRWCEIGCGTGFTASLLAAANPQMQFTAIDVNARHIECAMERSRAARLENIRFFDTDISTPRGGPPHAGPHDFIVVHGVYSWVSDDVRAAIRRFIANNLADGGVAYIHYMAHPGAAVFAAFHAVFRQALKASASDVGRAVVDGLKILSELRAAGAGLFALHPQAGQTLDHLAREDLDYVAHEYLSAAYAPIHSSTLIEEMGEAGLSFIGSATPQENIDGLSLPATTLKPIGETRDPAMRETLKDIARNQALRRDLFMRAPRALLAEEHGHALSQTRYRLVAQPPADGAITFDTRIGPVEGEAAVFGPLFSRLMEGPAGFAELRHLPLFQRQPGVLNQCLQMLLWAGFIHPLAEPACAPEVAQRFNAVVAGQAPAGRRIPALCVADIGSGLPPGARPPLPGKTPLDGASAKL